MNNFLASKHCFSLSTASLSSPLQNQRGAIGCGVSCHWCDRLEHVPVFRELRWTSDRGVWLAVGVYLAYHSRAWTETQTLTHWCHQVLKTTTLSLFPPLYWCLTFLLQASHNLKMYHFSGLRLWQGVCLLWARGTSITWGHTTLGWRCGEERTWSSPSGWEMMNIRNSYCVSILRCNMHSIRQRNTQQQKGRAGSG